MPSISIHKLTVLSYALDASRPARIFTHGSFTFSFPEGLQVTGLVFLETFDLVFRVCLLNTISKHTVSRSHSSDVQDKFGCIEYLYSGRFD